MTTKTTKPPEDSPSPERRRLWPNGLDEWWPLVLGLRSGWPELEVTTQVAADALPTALGNLEGWSLCEEADEVWLRSTFRFPVFEAAAIFTNFLFASIQMTTYPIAYGFTLDDDGKATVRLSGPTRKALTWGVVLFAGVLSHAFFLTRDKPERGGGEGAS